MTFPTVFGIPILMIIGFIIVAIQIIIRIGIMNNDNSVYRKHFEFEKQKYENIFIRTKFYFNPPEWKELNTRWIQVLLIIHLLLSVPLLCLMLIL